MVQGYLLPTLNKKVTKVVNESSELVMKESCRQSTFIKEQTELLERMISGEYQLEQQQQRDEKFLQAYKNKNASRKDQLLNS